MKRILGYTVIVSIVIIGVILRFPNIIEIDYESPEEKEGEMVTDIQEISKENNDIKGEGAKQENTKDTKQSTFNTYMDLLKKQEVEGNITTINGILLVNKVYPLPENYDPGENPEAIDQLNKMIQAAKEDTGKKIQSVSGYRTYSYQKGLYERYVKKDGEEKASKYSAKPGHSEHQTGLAFDIGGEDSKHWIKTTFEDTEEGKWLMENAHKFGYILRYPKNKTHITGYIYEPWHYRYVGVEHATNIYGSELTLEEYLLK